jgi:hypothetical protein
VTDSFEHSRHKLRYSLNFSKNIQEKVGKVRMSKVQAPNTGPLIVAVRDSLSGLTDGTLTLGGVLDIAGSRLKVYADQPGDGVYFIAFDGTEYKASVLVENKPSRLIVMIPNLSPGVYTLEIRTHSTSNSIPGKQLRKAQFAKLLNV